MNKINWIIIRSNNRGTDYGVGTFIKQFSDALILHEEINVFIIDLDENLKEFCIENREGIVHFKFGISSYPKNHDTVTYQSKYAKSIVRLVLNYLPKGRQNVIHMNFVRESFIGKEFKNFCDCCLIFTQHLLLTNSASNGNQFDIEYQTYAIADKIITVTKEGKDHLINKNVDGRKISTIYNGIDPNLFMRNVNAINIRQKYGIETNKRIILYSGRLDNLKGLKYLAQAFSLLLKKLPDCRLIIAGNGNYEEIIKASSEFTSKINYLGFIPFNDLKELYYEASIGIIPSLEEQCSYVALEMLHSGLPVVASAVGGLKEIFSHNKDAYLVDLIPNALGVNPDIHIMSKYALKLLINNKKAEEFSENAKRKAIRDFTSTVMCRKYLKVIN